jgi:hypothetical protein
MEQLKMSTLGQKTVHGCVSFLPIKKVMVSRNVKEVTDSTFQNDFIQFLSMSSHAK